METNNEIKDFNIAEILRYAPKMLELFSPIYGEVYFDYVNEEGTDIRVKTKLCGGSVATFNANGTFYDLPNSECLLFPSTHCRICNHWQNKLFLESIGSVCVDTITGNKFILDHKGTFFSDGTGSQFSTLIDENCCNYLLNSRYASPEETKEFFEELEKNGYKWDGKMVVKIEDKQKFYVGDNVYTWEDGKGLKKEQNKPKFKVDDWIVNNENGKVSQIKKIVYDESGYGYDHTNGWFHSVFEKDYHLWTIKDAKDGDVLMANAPFIFNGNLDGGIGCPGAYCAINTLGNFQIPNKPTHWTGHNTTPATKEQRELLFQKMHEAGFEWNADTKKLTKTTIPIPKFKVGDIVKFDRPSATVKREILSIDFENERYLTRRTDIGGAIKEFIYFCEQDDYVIVGSHNSLSNLSIEDKVSALADEILALKERVKALEIQVIKDMSTPPLTVDPYFKSNKITCDDAQCYKGKSASDTFETPDKAGDCVTLKDMKS